MSDILFQPLGPAIAAPLSVTPGSDVEPRLTRTHYFDGRLLTAEDLTRDQVYLDERLREFGRVLGSGIVFGLELSLEKSQGGRLIVQRGLGVTGRGRVLEVGSRLEVSLADRAHIADVNEGRNRYFSRALYAVVLNFAEVATGTAEVFPKDLGNKRGAQHSVVTEAVQLGLVPLPLPLSHQEALTIRAELMKTLLGNDTIWTLIPEDSIALGVLAIQDDTPQWLDAELLRHPLREDVGFGDLQRDLARQYERLLDDILLRRTAGGLGGNFAAREYFSILPPASVAPKQAFDPVSGAQRFFPENFSVHIAPVRATDVDTMVAESMGLPVIDLKSTGPVDVVVLVPLPDQEYGALARRLERPYQSESRRLPGMDPLGLRLFPRQPIHRIDTDVDVWRAIWDRHDSMRLTYVRRPTRAAETELSAIVLAQGAVIPVVDTERATPTPSPLEISVSPPENGTTNPPGNPPPIRVSVRAPETSPPRLLSEDGVFLRYVDLATLWRHRPGLGETPLTSLPRLSAHASRIAGTLDVLTVLLVTDRRYDAAVGPTLEELAAAGRLAEAAGSLRREPTLGLDDLIIPEANELGVSERTRSRWIALREADRP